MVDNSSQCHSIPLATDDGSAMVKPGAVFGRRTREGEGREEGRQTRVGERREEGVYSVVPAIRNHIFTPSQRVSQQSRFLLASLLWGEGKRDLSATQVQGCVSNREFLMVETAL